MHVNKMSREAPCRRVRHSFKNTKTSKKVSKNSKKILVKNSKNRTIPSYYSAAHC